MESGFTKANSNNLPKVDAIMLGTFFASNSEFCSSEFRNVKTSTGALVSDSRERGGRRRDLRHGRARRSMGGPDAGVRLCRHRCRQHGGGCASILRKPGSWQHHLAANFGRHGSSHSIKGKRTAS